ncbi:MAG: hypothetical protein IJL26_08355 [Clostridia bacterium]|nr:hypothetical protein [Clostridia bacterium]
MKKIKSLCALACALILFVCAVPVHAAGSYPEASSTYVSKWYLLGDIDRNGKVQASDACTILRIAAYQIEPPAAGSIIGGAADYDRDGSITSKDARLTLRRGAGLDPVSDAQVAHPYTKYKEKAPSKAAALSILNYANQLKAAPESGTTRNFNYKKTDVSFGDIAIKSGLSLSASAMKAMKKEISQRSTAEEEHSASYYTPSGWRSSAYYSYLPACGDPNFVFPEALAGNTALIKSVSKVTLNADNTYSIRITFNDFTVTKAAETEQLALLEQLLPDIHDSEQLKRMGNELANSMTGSDTEGITVEIHDEIRFSTSDPFQVSGLKNYYFQNAVTGAYVEYKFNPYGYPLSATYYSKQSITIPATLTLGIDSATFAMTSIEETTHTFTFTTSAVS